MNILLINLTRLGDLLEMQPVISGLRQRYPDDVRLGLVCLHNFSAAAELLDGLDDVYPLSGASLLAKLEKSWPSACAEAVAFCQNVGASFAPDRVLNLTPTPSARLLGRLLVQTAGADSAVPGSETPVASLLEEVPGIRPPAATLEGFGLDSFGFSVNQDPWAAFTQAASSQRGCSPFNITDQFRMIAGVGATVPANRLLRPAQADAVAQTLREEAAAELQKSAAGLAPKGLKGLVGLQLGASEDRRRWPVAHFARLGEQLAATGYMPVLLGSPAESGLAERYIAESTAPCLNYIGKTSLDGLAATVAALDLLVTNDTGTMHLAAGLGRPVLAIFLATAQPWDTGPYMENACCLEPDVDCHPCAFGRACERNTMCRTAIRPEVAARLALDYLGSGRWPDLPVREPAEQSGSRIWRSFSGEPRGFMDLASLSGHEGEDRTRWIRIQRHFYCQFLDGGGSAGPNPAQGPAQGGISPLAAPGIAPPPFAHGLSEELRAAIAAELSENSQRLHLLHEQVALLELRPTENARNRVISTMSRVRAAWAASRFFAVLGYLWLSQTDSSNLDLGGLKKWISQYYKLLTSWLAYIDE